MKDVTNTKKLSKKEKLVKCMSKKNLAKLPKKTISLFTKKSIKKVIKKIKQELNFILNKKHEKEEFNIARKQIILGIWTIFGLLFFFVLWGSLSKIDSAAIASGIIVVSYHLNMPK